MKSAMPYYGVSLPEVRTVATRVYDDWPLPTFAAWRSAVLLLWRKARFREERYLAIALSGHRAYRAYQTLEALPIYEELIVDGAWWDYVDDVAEHRVGPLLRAYPRPMKRTLRAWARDPDIWKRRSAIIAQINFKAETDLELLYDCIEPSLGRSEFWLRKAIGWALRVYARQDAHEVKRYVAAHADVLSPLTKREALKHVDEVSSTDHAK
jgi:3-methyladenine DNA glycosylase AlkD